MYISLWGTFVSKVYLLSKWTYPWTVSFVIRHKDKYSLNPLTIGGGGKVHPLKKWFCAFLLEKSYDASTSVGIGLNNAKLVGGGGKFVGWREAQDGFNKSCNCKILCSSYMKPHTMLCNRKYVRTNGHNSSTIFFVLHRFGGDMKQLLSNITRSCQVSTLCPCEY